MRSKLVLAAVLVASIVEAQETRKYHSGQLLQMESLQCTVFENPSSNADATDSAMCREYVLQGEDVLFHLRAKDVKHPLLLPVGKSVNYRIDENRFFVKLSAADRKEHEYTVVSMETRERPEGAVQSAMKVNHLQ